MATTAWTKLGKFIEGRSREGVRVEVSYPPDPGGLIEPMDRHWRLVLKLWPKHPGTYDPREIVAEGHRLDEVIATAIEKAETALPVLDEVVPRG